MAAEEPDWPGKPEALQHSTCRGPVSNLGSSERPQAASQLSMQAPFLQVFYYYTYLTCIPPKRCDSTIRNSALDTKSAIVLCWPRSVEILFDPNSFMSCMLFVLVVFMMKNVSMEYDFVSKIIQPINIRMLHVFYTLPVSHQKTATAPPGTVPLIHNPQHHCNTE